MASVEYSLFRANFIKSSLPSFFEHNLSSPELLLRAILEKPSSAPKKGYIWHIGNVELFSQATGQFAVGRTNRSTIEMFDAESGNFLEQEFETSPYTRCVFDAEIGIIGIANKASLVPSVKYLAFRTQDLLAHTEVVLETNTYVNIAPIPDPNDFVSTLETAYRVSRFTATFHGPNPFDADELFQKPLSVYLYSANGNKGKAQIQGEDLNRDVIQSVARSTAATGNEASATIRREKGQRSTVVHLRGDAAKRRYDEDEKPEVVLKDLQGLYKRVRLNEDN